MKVLIISKELWSNKNNGGNVLSNLFEDFDAQFAQIYCSSGIPENTVCKHYYQMTDFMMLNNLFKRKRVGCEFDFPNVKKNKGNITAENRFYKFFRKNHWFVFDIFRELLWKIAKWDNTQLDSFVKYFNPDIIFAPCYSSHYMLSITRYVSKLTNVKIISYISDDNYSLKQFSLSPFFWLNRFILRYNIRKTFKYYDLTYTMTDEQMYELKKDLGAKMKILRKGAGEVNTKIKTFINKPIRLVYAGNLCCGRIKTLSFLVKEIQKININRKIIRLDIYTNSEIKNSKKLLINDSKNSFLHGVVSPQELNQIYHSSDVALHVESFDLKNRLMTRLSFSTKIVDCLGSSCAVLAIAWEKHSGLIYLKNEDAAFCIDNLKEIEKLLTDIVTNPSLLLEYREKALDCSIRNHNLIKIRKDFFNDFKRLINN